jgi:sulfate permease, SulP family
VYSLVALAAVTTVLLAGGSLLALVPTAALGAIVVYAEVSLVDVAGFRRLAAFRRSELLLAVAAVAGVLVFGLLFGVLAAIGLSVVELLHRVARPHDAVQGFVPGLAGMHDIDDYPQATTMPGLLVYRYDSPLFSPTPRTFSDVPSPPWTRSGNRSAGSSSTSKRTSRLTRVRPASGRPPGAAAEPQ